MPGRTPAPSATSGAAQSSGFCTSSCASSSLDAASLTVTQAPVYFHHKQHSFWTCSLVRFAGNRPLTITSHIWLCISLLCACVCRPINTISAEHVCAMITINAAMMCAYQAKLCNTYSPQYIRGCSSADGKSQCARTALTRVPRGCPGPGCTTMPAAWSMHCACAFVCCMVNGGCSCRQKQMAPRCRR